jgi:hypothetical protein
MGNSTEALHSTLLWTYSRGTWQYDLICALILAFIFLIPPSFFNRKTRHDGVGPAVQGSRSRQLSPTDTEQKESESAKPQPKVKP